MTNTSIQSTTDPKPLAVPEAALPGRPKVRPKNPFYHALKALASLRLTVVLFVLSFILVFVGTLAQMDAGIWNVIKTYFWSIYVWVPFQVLVHFSQVFFWVNDKAYIPGAFPFPGGFTLGCALLLNLLAAHLVRFKLSWKRSGILLIHGGLVLMMLGEFITREFAIEGNMTIREGEMSNYLDHRDRCELVFISSADANNDNVVVVPDSKIRWEREISHGELPVDIEVKQFMPNSQLRVVEGSKLHNQMLEMGEEALKLVPVVEAMPADNLADAGMGTEIYPVSRAPGVGVDTEAKFDIPAAYVTFFDKKTGKPLGTYLFSIWSEIMRFPAQTIEVAGKTYQVSLRFKRTYKDYQMHLLKVTAQMYPGTNIAKDYSSLVRLVDEDHNENRKLTIYMNAPLRYRGETFYQSGVNGNETILQVVRNPGWLLPYVSCVLVAVGMLIHFILNLSTFLNRRAAS
jgi:ResB-like family